ncbi:MAG: prolyl oligopeptidase family serine peptidase [Pseudomonadota bacterium]|nr:prolyl oligopeptidase family serine peptidase [Pseudomonadota bacterium]
MEAMRAQDLFRHRLLMSLASDASQSWLVFGMKQAREGSDDYVRTLWGLPPGADKEPRQLTSPIFGATSPVLHPDGTSLGFVSDRGDEGAQVHILALDGGEARRLTDAASERLSTIEGWSNDGSRLLATATVEWKEDDEEEPPATGRPPSVARFLPYKRDGSGITVGHRTHLYAIDACNGELQALTRGDFDVVSGAWSPDGTRLAFIRHRGGRQRHRTDLWIADAEGGDARPVVEQLASIEAFAWSPDSHRLALCGGEVQGDSAVGLWLVDAGGGQLRRVGGEDLELSANARPFWHPDGRRVATVADLRGFHRLAIIDIDQDQVHALPARLRSVERLAQCADRLCFIVTAMDALDEIHSVDWEGGDERVHTHCNDWFFSRQRPRASMRQFDVPDGAGGSERIDAWLLLPAEGEGHDGGPYPLLVDMHGGPHSTALVDFSAHTYWYLLLSRGWAVLAPNAVGSAGYGREFAHRLCGRWGELDLPQHEAIIRSLQGDNLADDRLACAGKSYGGFLAAWAIGHCGLFRAAAIAAPVANIGSHMGTSDTGYYVTPFAMDCRPEEDPDLYHRLSPITECHKATAATLILQGENDGRCPRGQAEELFAHLIRCTEVPVELVVYPESSHAEAESGRPSNRVDYHQRVADWLDHHANGSRDR